MGHLLTDVHFPGVEYLHSYVNASLHIFDYLVKCSLDDLSRD
jgi:hypothetical protein